jgi:hypothetical protein
VIEVEEGSPKKAVTMVTTRSGSKRKSAEGIEPDESQLELPNASKRQRLPMRRKGRPSSSSVPDEDNWNAEVSASSISKHVVPGHPRQGAQEPAVEDQDSAMVDEMAATTAEAPRIIRFDHEHSSAPTSKDSAPAAGGSNDTTAPNASGHKQGDDEESDGEESDDEAPEAISNVQAAASAKEAAHATQKAAKE